ncbi:hypothetical protein PoB_001605600 [Plakobranchus ocellatus]|uniref:Uncharacterized protein n=1 Tax=Plakobranchus ocellatus TaxID=259542 RepID=A0AAV3Z139_9GAST|nr:hypothetical protein PoB_001605600 [Plakobranchus ocellatus]
MRVLRNGGVAIVTALFINLIGEIYNSRNMKQKVITVVIVPLKGYNGGPNVSMVTALFNNIWGLKETLGMETTHLVITQFENSARVLYNSVAIVPC